MLFGGISPSDIGNFCRPVFFSCSFSSCIDLFYSGDKRRSMACFHLFSSG